MTDVTQFPGLSGYDLASDSHVDGLLDLGQEIMGQDPDSSSKDDFFFPTGKPAVTKRNLKFIDAEVGDDLIAVSNNWRYLSKRIDVLERYLDLRISYKDTSLNNGIGNFAEALVRIPRHYKETWLSQKSLRETEAFGFIDVPKIRLLLPVKNQVARWSSTEIGKFSDYAQVSNWVSPDNPYHGVIQIGSLIQDALLGATSRRNCVYMPKDFGGAGKRIPFSHANMPRFLGAWKGGSQTRLVTAVVKQANQFLLSAMTMGRQPKIPKILEHFTKCEPIFTDWIKDQKSLHAVRAADIEVPCEPIGMLRFDNPEHSPLMRLVTANLVFTKTKMAIAIEHNALSRALCGTVKISEFVQMRKRIHEDWKKSSAPLKITEEIEQELKLYASRDAMESDFFRFYKSTVNVHGFRRFIQSEPVYGPEAMEQVYCSGVMNTHHLYAQPNRLLATKFVGGWDHDPDFKDGTEMPYELQNLLEWFINRQGEMPRLCTDDDEVIFKKVCENPSVLHVIVTDDTKLCRRVGNVAMCLRIPVEFYYRMVYFGEGLEPFLGKLPSIIRLPGPWVSHVLHEDTGSIQSGEEKYFLDGMLYPEGAVKVTLDHGKPWNHKPKEVRGPELDFDKLESLPYGFPGKFLFGISKRPRARDFTRG